MSWNFISHNEIMWIWLWVKGGTLKRFCLSRNFSANCFNCWPIFFLIHNTRNMKAYITLYPFFLINTQHKIFTRRKNSQMLMLLEHKTWERKWETIAWHNSLLLPLKSYKLSTQNNFDSFLLLMFECVGYTCLEMKLTIYKM